MSDSKKVLIFIVAYNAEKTIESVLSRIPVDKLPAATEVLIIDDSSQDDTFQKARGSRGAAAGLPVTVLRTPENQGYGGNQTIGYQYAIENGFDVVALVHGDGQYAPEKLPELIEPVLSGEADACFGSRMMERGVALKGGMPLYKYVGNRMLSVFQNCLLGTKMTEFHSGYRVYSVDALAKVPFRYNTKDFHFDTEIIIQFVRRGLRIKELPIPTYYGDEICYVNGVAYAWHVVMTTLASRIHGVGLFYDPKFDVWGEEKAYDLKVGYVSSHSMAIGMIGQGSSILDLACGQGLVAGELRRKDCRVTGVDRVPADEANFEKFVLHDLDEELPPDLGTFDYILALDCLEHLGSPEALLARLRAVCYSKDCSLILTAPNIGFLPMRLGLLLGQFNYGKRGILDLTHRRLFTFRSFRRLLEQEGYRVRKMRGVPAPFVKALGDNAFARCLTWINRVFAVVWPQVFAYQVYAEAEFTAPLEHLLKKTLESGESGE